MAYQRLRETACACRVLIEFCALYFQGSETGFAPGTLRAPGRPIPYGFRRRHDERAPMAQFALGGYEIRRSTDSDDHRRIERCALENRAGFGEIGRLGKGDTAYQVGSVREDGAAAVAGDGFR
jgi:hypothetical protein